MQDNKVDRTIRFTYDTYGNQTSRVDQDNNNSVGGNGLYAVSKPSAYVEHYEYDSAHNWTRKTDENSDGMYKSLSERKITYSK